MQTMIKMLSDEQITQLGMQHTSLPLGHFIFTL